MRLAVFGASGGTGRQIVKLAVESGHDVTAVVRPGSKLNVPAGAEVVTADVMDPLAITPAVERHNAVVSAIGPRTTGPTSVCHDATRSITSAMRAAGVNRLVVVSQATVTTDGDGPVTRIAVKPLLRRLLRHAISDALRMEEHLRSADLDWTVVRPPRLTNGRGAGRYRTAYGANVRRGFNLSRRDLAAAVLAALEDPATVGTAIGVAR